MVSACISRSVSTSVNEFDAHRQRHAVGLVDFHLELIQVGTGFDMPLEQFHPVDHVQVRLERIRALHLDSPPGHRAPSAWRARRPAAPAAGGRAGRRISVTADRWAASRRRGATCSRRFRAVRFAGVLVCRSSAARMRDFISSVRHGIVSASVCTDAAGRIPSEPLAGCRWAAPPGPEPVRGRNGPQSG